MPPSERKNLVPGGGLALSAGAGVRRASATPCTMDAAHAQQPRRIPGWAALPRCGVRTSCTTATAERSVPSPRATGRTAMANSGGKTPCTCSQATGRDVPMDAATEAPHAELAPARRPRGGPHHATARCRAMPRVSWAEPPDFAAAKLWLGAGRSGLRQSRKGSTQMQNRCTQNTRMGLSPALPSRQTSHNRTQGAAPIRSPMSHLRASACIPSASALSPSCLRRHALRTPPGGRAAATHKPKPHAPEQPAQPRCSECWMLPRPRQHLMHHFAGALRLRPHRCTNVRATQRRMTPAPGPSI